VAEEREVEENGGEEREGKETDGCPLTPMLFLIRLAVMTVLGFTLPAHKIIVSLPKISPDNLMEVVGQEADHHAIKSGNSKKDESDVALSASTSSREGKKGGGESNVKCYNCHKKSHIKANCWAKGGRKEGQRPKGKGKVQPKKEQAAVVIRLRHHTCVD
jgi:hypothetical protein